MRYKFISTGVNHAEWIEHSLLSIDAQEMRNFDVMVVDDGSDDGAAQIIKDFCEARGWQYKLNNTRLGATVNQVFGVRAMEPNDDDVIVWVDGDDWLPHGRVLNRLQSEYENGALMTYGSYKSVPYSNTCPIPQPYPAEVVADRSYRRYGAKGGGLLFNHLRTVSGYVWNKLDDYDFQDDHGSWYKCSADTAVMIPALEISGERCHFIPDVLYCYNSENPYSDWRRWARQVDTDHYTILHKSPRLR